MSWGISELPVAIFSLLLSWRLCHVFIHHQRDALVWGYFIKIFFHNSLTIWLIWLFYLIEVGEKQRQKMPCTSLKLTSLEFTCPDFLTSSQASYKLTNTAIQGSVCPGVRQINIDKFTLLVHRTLHLSPHSSAVRQSYCCWKIKTWREMSHHQECGPI